MTFQSTPSAWRETAMRRTIRQVRGISIHSLRMEGDETARHGPMRNTTFQSTPSAWRETTGRVQCAVVAGDISIHSLRMEGDHGWNSTPGTQRQFQSTPSAWRETYAQVAVRYEKLFQSTPSAWRETGYADISLYSISYFNPLPPHGGRLVI